MKKFICTMLLALIICNVRATHVSGGDISYTCLGGNVYQVSLKLFRDCSGINLGTTQTIALTNDCGYATQYYTASIVLDPITGLNYTNISQLCSIDSLNSTCYSGGLPGMQQFTYQTTITLTQTCSAYRFSWSVCCRNSSSNLVGQSSPYFEASLNNVDAACNNSPVFTGQPIPYVCVNQPVVYSYGLVEADGNDLRYSLVSARYNISSTVNYQSPYTGTNPITGISLDSLNGQLTFTPTIIGNFVVVINVKEYNSSGILIGNVFRDMQFVVQSCANNVGDYSLTTFTNITGSAIIDFSNNLQVCEGDNFCVDLTFTDLDITDVISLSSNVVSVLPGATFNWVSSGNIATATICWTAISGMASINSFTIEINDNACPLPGISSYTNQVNFIPNVNAGADQTLCLGDLVTLNASGGSNFSWSLISGDPLVIGSNISCTNCASPVVNPALTSIYEVESIGLPATCVNKDTLEVSIVPNFTHTLNPTTDTVCLNEETQYFTDVTTSGSYSYAWSPTIFLNDSLIDDPFVMPTIPGTYYHIVTIQNSSGCIKQDTIILVVSNSAAPAATVNMSSDTIMIGDTVSTSMAIGTAIPIVSGPSLTTLCSQAPMNIDIGTQTGLNSYYSYPAPYGNYYKNARHQFLFTVAELNAMGFNGGKLTEIAWEVTQIYGTTSYLDYSIKMGVTSSSSLSGWETGLTTVFSPQNITINTGWNTHVLTTAYEWNGTSNIVIEICYNNLALNYTYNSITPYESTSFVSALYYRSDGAVACSSSSYTTSARRPVTRFTTCDISANLSNYSFLWTPTLGVNNPTTANPFLYPSATTTYTVNIVENSSGCFNNLGMTVFVNSPLPIELLDFLVAVDKKNKLVNAEWITVSEINNDYFLVQRSKNMTDWDAIAKIDGYGNSNQVLHYKTRDLSPLTGVSYYRLKQIDFDGSFSFSETKSVQFKEDIFIYPNPTTGLVKIRAEERLIGPIHLLNGLGKMVNVFETGTNEIDLSKLENGLYFLRINKTMTKIILIK